MPCGKENSDVRPSVSRGRRCSVKEGVTSVLPSEVLTTLSLGLGAVPPEFRAVDMWGRAVTSKEPNTPAG